MYRSKLVCLAPSLHFSQVQYLRSRLGPAIVEPLLEMLDFGKIDYDSKSFMIQTPAPAMLPSDKTRHLEFP
jgi:hypothetical protein